MLPNAPAARRNAATAGRKVGTAPDRVRHAVLAPEHVASLGRPLPSWDLVDLDEVTMPVALVPGAHDEFVPHAVSLPFLDAVPSDDTEASEFPTNLVGTFTDRTVHEEWWPRVSEWFAERS